MSEISKSRTLGIFLRVWAIACIVVMCINWTAFIFKLVSFNPGGVMAFMIWDDVYGHVGPMIFVVYIVWSVYLYKASYDLEKNRTFLEFSLWSNLAHSLVMIPMALNDAMYHSKFLTDIPFIGFLAIALYMWMPKKTAVENQYAK